MSKQVDERVVSMQFDNKNFERNVQTTMSTLDKLKQKLHLDGAAKGLENVNTAAKNINMSGLSSGIETVQAKFSALGVMGVTALANITNQAVNAGKRIASSFTIDPIKTGFQEYETQINAVQTILANTESKGSTIKDVNAALDELNTYADKTIYNFTEMTRNIGTFTAAGVDLDTSVSAIKGIANLAAVSGSTSQQASTAMYQLSQALSSGTVKLQDWNSVVNAGMGGQVFQDALKETAKVHGIAIDQMIKDEGSFRETLKNGWLTSDILTETLSKFTGDLNEQQLKTMGYSDEQIKSIMKMGQTANDAATKVKTFTQLFDTLKEAAQSGWTQSWEIIVGDFEEAKELLTEVSDVFSGIIGSSADARNKLLQGWKDAGGRTMAIEALSNTFQGLLDIIKPIKEAFREVFPPATSEQLVKITERIRDLSLKFKELAEKYAPQIKSTFKGLFSIIKIGTTIIKSIVSGIGQLIGKFTGLGGGILGVTGSIGDWISKLSDSITKSNVFGKAIDKVVGFLGKAIDKIKEFSSFIKGKFEAPGFETFLNIVNTIWNTIKKVGAAVIKVASSIGKALGNAFRNGDIKSLLDLVNGGLITAILIKLKSWVSGFKGLAGEGKSFINSIKEVLGTVGDSLEAWQQNLKAGTLQKIAIAIGILAASLWVLSGIDPDKLGSALGAITVLFIELMGAMKTFDKLGVQAKGAGKSITLMIGMSVAVLILASAVKKLSGLDWDELGKGVAGVGILLAELVGAAKLMSVGGKNISKGAVQLIFMAAALKIMASVCKDLSVLSWEELAKGVSGIGGILAIFAGFAGLIKLIKPQKMMSSALSLILIGAAMEIFANVCSKFGKMEWGDLGKAGAAIGGILLIAAGFGKLSSYAGKMVSSSVALILIGAAMEIFTDVCSKFGKMEWEELGKAGAAIAGILILAAGFTLLSGLSKKLLSSVISLTIMAAAMEIFANVCQKFGQMEWEALGKAGAAIAGILILAAGFALLAGLAPNMIASAAALLIMAASLAILTPVLKVLGEMSWESIIKGLVAIAAAFAIFGIAGALLGPVIPAILGLSAAITLFGLGCLAAGIGIAAFAAGLMALSTLTAASATAIVAALYIIVVGILEMIPAMIGALTDAIVALCQVFIQSVPAICEAIKVLIFELVNVLNECVPVLADGALKLIVGILNALIQYAPQLVNGLVDLIIALLNALAPRVQEFVGSVVGFLVALLDGVSAHIGELIEAGARLIGAIFQGIASVIGPIIESVLVPILEVLKDLIVGIVEAIAPYIPVICDAITKVTDLICNAVVKIVEAIAPYIPIICDAITKVTEVVCNAIVKIVETIAPYIPDITSMIETIINAIVSIVEQISPIIDSITNLIDQLGKSIKEILDGIGNTVKDFGDAIKTSLDGVAGVFDSAFGGVADVINSVGDTIKKFLDGIANVIDSVGEAALNAGAGFEKLANGVKTITKLNLADMAASLAAVALGIGKITKHSSELAESGKGMKQIADGVKVSADAFNKMSVGITAVTAKLASFGSIARTAMNSMAAGFRSGGASIIAAMTSLLNAMTTAIRSRAGQFGTIGKTIAVRFASGVKSGSSMTKSAFSSALSSAVSNARSYYTSFYGAGSYVAQGFADGIKDNRYKAEAQARIMAQNAATAAAKALKINSPSKVFRSIAYSVPEGFAQGIDKKSWMVEDSATSMAEKAINNTKSIISRIADVATSDIDAQPTIRPVLDLSDVSSGARAIDGMFSMRPSVGVLSNVRSISSMMNRGQNGTNNDVISAIKDLKSSFNNTPSNVYNVNGVTYDDGSNISDAVKTLVRAAKVERRS